MSWRSAGARLSSGSIFSTAPAKPGGMRSLTGRSPRISGGCRKSGFSPCRCFTSTCVLSASICSRRWRGPTIGGLHLRQTGCSRLSCSIFSAAPSTGRASSANMKRALSWSALMQCWRRNSGDRAEKQGSGDRQATYSNSFAQRRAWRFFQPPRCHASETISGATLVASANTICS